MPQLSRHLPIPLVGSWFKGQTRIEMHQLVDTQTAGSHKRSATCPSRAYNESGAPQPMSTYHIPDADHAQVLAVVYLYTSQLIQPTALDKQLLFRFSDHTCRLCQKCIQPAGTCR